MTVPPPAPSYRRHRYPAEIIAHCVWLYFCLPQSYRQVELLMAQRGIEVTHETPGGGAVPPLHGRPIAPRGGS